MSSQDNSDGLLALVMCAFFALLMISIVGFIIFMYTRASNRKVTDAVPIKPTKDMRLLIAPLPPQDAANRVVSLAPSQGFQVSDVSLDGSRVILGTNPGFSSYGFFTYGFFYPIYFTAQLGGWTLIEVGVVPKVYQWGPVVTMNQDKCIGLVRVATGATFVPVMGYGTSTPQPPPPQSPPYPPYPQSPPPNVPPSPQQPSVGEQGGSPR